MSAWSSITRRASRTVNPCPPGSILGRASNFFRASSAFDERPSSTTPQRRIRVHYQPARNAIGDVIDGRFVPEISSGPSIVKAIRKSTGKPLNVHLMVVEPGGLLER